MINCLNEPYDAYRRAQKAKRRKWLLEHSKLYNWYCNTSYYKKKIKKMKEKEERNIQKIKELLRKYEEDIARNQQ